MTRHKDGRDRKSVSVRLFKMSGKKTTLDVVVEKFKELLKSGDLKPGDRIPSEIELAKSFSASRGSIREAVKILASYGLLRVKWGDGTYVCDSIDNKVFDSGLFQLILSPGDKRHLLELRKIIECGIVELAIDNVEEEDFAAIEKAHVALGEMILNGETDADRLGTADALFHVKLGKATHNPLVEKLYSFALELYYPSIVITQKNRHSIPMLMQTQQVHQNILDAVHARDREAAKQAVIDSLAVWHDYL